MAVVTKQEMSERLQIDLGAPNEIHSLRINPLPLPEDFDEDAVDLRLGSSFFVPRGHRSPHFCPGDTAAESLYQEEFVPVGEYLVLPAHQTVLGATLEFIKLPIDMSGQVLTKSSWARTFITIATAPWIHPLYRGCLTLEIANVSNTPIILYPGVTIAQLILFKNGMHPSSPCHKSSSENPGQSNPPEDRIESTYTGPTRPEPSKLDPPEDALWKIGIEGDRILHPYDEYQELILQDPRYREKFREIFRAADGEITPPATDGLPSSD